MNTPQQQTLKPVPNPVKPSRMTLGAVVKGKLDKPYRVGLYGPAGIGKTTFGANAPNPIFLGAEDGTAQVDVARFPKPETFADVLDAVRVLEQEPHEYQTLVVDSLDWIEPLMWRDVCRKAGVELIEEVGGGYGKGYTAAVDEWRRFIAALERLQAVKGMHVILLAHAHIKKFQNPEGEDYDRYQFKLNDKAAGIIQEWCEAVLFAKYETYANKDAKTKRVRGVDTGARLIHTEQRAAFDAKNRYSLPETLPLSWADFDAAAKAGRVAPVENLREEILRKAKELGPELEKTIAATVEKAGSSAQALALINNRVNARLAEVATAQTADSAEKAS